MITLRSSARPVVSAALAWAGREILPELAAWLLDTLDSRTSQRRARGAARGRETRAAGTGDAGRQPRHRRRGGNR